MDICTKLDKNITGAKKVQALDPTRKTEKQFSDIWDETNKKTSYKCDAIIAISNTGKAMLVKMTTTVPWKIEAQEQYDTIADIIFENTLPGLYEAKCTGINCSYTGDDSFEVIWKIVKPLYIVGEN